MTSTLSAQAPAQARNGMDSAPRGLGLRLRRVEGRADWRRVRAMRFEDLFLRGDVPDSGDREFGDAWDAQPESVTIVLEDRESMLASTRSSLRSARSPLPCEGAFGREIGEIAGGGALVEASLSVVDPAAPIDPVIALVHLFKGHLVRCKAQRAEWLVATVRESQIGFYRRVFGMEILSGAEACPGLLAPRVLMGLRVREQAAALARRIPALAATAQDEHDLAS